MDAEGIREIAKMQNKIDCYEYFIGNLYLKLAHPDKDIACVATNNDICEGVWKEVERIQNQVKDNEH